MTHDGDAGDRAALRDLLTASLERLSAYEGDPTGRPHGQPALGALLDRAEALAAAAPAPQPVRLVHHFACAGGTVISKCLAAMPNTVLLSEIDPLSQQMIKPDIVEFQPTDLIRALRGSARGIGDGVILQTFLGALTGLRGALSGQYRHLVLRDHAHSQFCLRIDPASRPSLGQIVSGALPVRQVVTLRHPLDSFLSLDAAGWRHFAPFTLEEYARRYTLFLDHYADVPRVTYEEFTRDPGPVLERICAVLDLPYSERAIERIGMIRLTGDSGRKSDRIAPRPRRPVPAAIAAQRGDSPTYALLCDRLGYAP